MAPLRNPERRWSHAARADRGAAIDRAEIERRIGPTSGAVEVLGGGFSNLNVRIGDDRVLRIARDPAGLAKELALLRRPWRSFTTPSVLATGDDFVVLERLTLLPLRSTAGAQAGRALAEIHATTYPEMGVLGADLSIVEPMDPGAGVGGYVRHQLDAAAPYLDAAFVTRLHEHLARIADDAAAAIDGPVLCHGDFKVSNLHLTPSGALVVLDWEFAWAGTRLMDVGQLLRWRPPDPFVRAFADAYREAGGVLAPSWRRVAAAFDLGNLLGLFARYPVMRTTDDIPRRIAETLDAG